MDTTGHESGKRKRCNEFPHLFLLNIGSATAADTRQIPWDGHPLPILAKTVTRNINVFKKKYKRFYFHCAKDPMQHPHPEDQGFQVKKEGNRRLERVAGIEPARSAWEAIGFFAMPIRWL
ncbi:hypothetical protein [Shinella zoogloeoides]|uniref:hypothetical protein n=1 Tax=Shinella zoogloeoides TaxID=352475 RepID=UPI0028A917F5|nr:hypothetical protein [Shinella zoogloeoides]